MREKLEDFKVIIAEIAGIIIGLIWSQHSGWDYEPLLLLVTSALGLTISLSLFFLKRKETAQHSLVVINSGEPEITQLPNIIHIEPEEITSKIKSVSLYQQDDIAISFKGLYVKWKLELFVLHRAGEDIYINMRPISGANVTIGFITSIDKNPILKIAEAKQIFDVFGQITMCDAYNIKMDLISLTKT